MHHDNEGFVHCYAVAVFLVESIQITSPVAITITMRRCRIRMGLDPTWFLLRSSFFNSSMQQVNDHAFHVLNLSAANYSFSFVRFSFCCSLRCLSQQCFAVILAS